MITADSLQRAGLAAYLAARYAGPLTAACERFNINTPSRQAGFFGQCWVESAGFTALVESLYYSLPARIVSVFPTEVPDIVAATPLAHNPEGLALAVYSNRLGNGPAASGDGWAFIGRGLSGLTGRSNYAAAAAALGRPYLEHPELVSAPLDSCLTAAWFWDQRGCNAMADAHDWPAITRAWNGPGMLDASERQARTLQALGAFA